MEWLATLGDLTDRGVSVLLLHHPRKGTTLAGQAARGSGALGSNVDILVEMNWYGKPEDEDRRRWLRAYSRHEETRRHLIVELTAAGDDYLARQPLADGAADESSQVVFMVLEDASERLTQRQILEWWPDDFRKPDPTTIWRALQRGVEQGLIRQTGTGRRNDPRRYWLPSQEIYFHPGPGASQEKLQRWQEAWQKRNLEALLSLVDRNQEIEGGTEEGGDRRQEVEGGDQETGVGNQEAEGRKQETVLPEPALTPDPCALTPGQPAPATEAIPMLVAGSRVESAEPPVEAPAAPVVVKALGEPERPAASPVPVSPRQPVPPPTPAERTAPTPPAAPRKPAPEPEESVEAARKRSRRWPG
jgi:hypothetical protein